MLTAGERVLVAVSGGKDSPGGVGHPRSRSATRPTGSTSGSASASYSDASAVAARSFARLAGSSSTSARSAGGLRLRRPDRSRASPAACRARRAGSPSGTSSTPRPSTAATTSSPPATTSTTRRPCCSATSLRWHTDYLGRQLPVLPARHGFPRKVKPLVRLGEREIAAYCVVRGHRLPRRGVPDGRGQQAPRLQGRAQRDRGPVTRHEGRLLPRLPRPLAPLLADHAAIDRPGSAPCRTLRRAHDRRGVRVLPPPHADGGPRTGPGRAASAGGRR